METFPLNNLAEKFEVDRSTTVRAMRGVPPPSYSTCQTAICPHLRDATTPG